MPELSQQAGGSTASVTVFSSDGEIEQVIGVGSACATNLTFASENLGILYITGSN